ncbi:peptidylprolyl isomerase [Pedobacter sp.]|uniref:peptidylprolyl isomerase n=1 Tax=Pedobacter sp. TaxID=1411316 RepID=UPI0031CE013D
MRVMVFLIFSLYISVFSAYGQVSKVALQINDIAVSQSEFNFLLDEYVAAYKKVNGAQPPHDTLHLWKSNYIDRMLLIADAHDRLLVNKNVDVAVQVMSKYMIALPTSSFYLSKFGKAVSEQELLSAYEKRKIKYEIEYFQFDNTDNLAEFFLVNGKDPFTNPSLKSSLKQITLIWPVSKFAFERIWNLKEGEVSHPINSRLGHYLLRVKAIKKNEQRAFDLEKDKISTTLKMHHQILANHRYVEELKRGIEFDTSSIKQLWADYSTGLLKKQSLLLGQEDKLLTYWIGKEKFSVRLKDFLDYYNYLPIRQKLNTLQHLYDFLISIVVTEELYKEAVTSGFTKESDFLFRQNRFRNKVILDQYYRSMAETMLKSNDTIKGINPHFQKELILKAKKKFKPIINFEF